MTQPLDPALSKETIRAAKHGDVAKLQSLLEQVPSLLHARDSDGSTPLHCATWKGHAGVVALLIRAGADLHLENENDHWGGTSLHAAAHGNQKAAAELLLAAGADPNRVSRNGRTPLQETEFHKATAVAKLLRQHGASEG